MENEEIENIDSQNDTEATENANEESVESTETEETEFDIDAEVKKQTATLFARMKKAEQEAKELKAKLATNSGSSKQTQADLSNTDLYALMEAKVPKDDIDEVRDYAKLKNISIEEALKSSIVKATLREKAENRKSNEVANTSGARRGTARVSDEALVDNFRKGILPESDDDFDRLVKARKAR